MGRDERRMLALLAGCFLILGSGACGGDEGGKGGPGGGGTGGTGGIGGTGGTGGEGPGGRGGGGEGGEGGEGGTVPVERCGDGTATAGESCDGDDLGGATCTSRGFAAGTLACAGDCTFDETGCVPFEVCGNGADDDGDGDVDCADDGCDDDSRCNVCGDGRVDRLEPCDGDDVRGESCVSRGFPLGGVLACVDCALDDSGCLRPELCEGGADEDGDGLVDCADAGDCAADAACTPGAFCHTAIVLADAAQGTTDGAGDRFAGSCLGAGEPEGVFVVTPGAAGETGNLRLVLGGGHGLHVRAGCDDAGSELACTAPAVAGEPATLDLAAQGGVPLWVIVEGAAGSFDLAATWDRCGNGLAVGTEACDPPDGDTCSATCARVETACGNHVDDDGDGRIDCEDADACAGADACIPGTGVPGAPCVAATDCAATVGADPSCLDELGTGHPGGLCSESCVLGVAGECPAGSACIDVGRGAGRGLCLPTCVDASGCRAGHACAPAGGPGLCVPACGGPADCPAAGGCDPSTGLCVIVERCADDVDDDGDGLVDCRDDDCRTDPACAGPETSCADFVDDDGDGVIDCADPGCACTPGTGAAGAPCTAAGDCRALAGGGDPACLDEARFHFPGGACTELCSVAAQDCPSSTRCVSLEHVLGPSFQGDDGVCMRTCTQGITPCASGLVCKAADPTTLHQFCWPDEDCANGGDDDLDGDADCADPECGVHPACVTYGLCGVPPPITASVTSDTTLGATDAWNAFNYGDYCYELGTGLGERVYHHVPGAAGQWGTVQLRLDSATDQGFYVRTTCDAASTEIICMDMDVGGWPELATLKGIRGDQDLFIFVEPYEATEAGPFTLTVGYTPWVCGNGVLDDGEYCDDGNLVDGDGCDSDCGITETEPNDTMATADPVIGGHYAGGIFPVGDADWLSIPVGQAGGTLVVTLTVPEAMGCVSGEYDTYLEVYDPNGTLVGYNDDINPMPQWNFCSRVDVPSAAVGTYYAKVTAKTWYAPMGVNYAAHKYRLGASVEFPLP